MRASIEDHLDGCDACSRIVADLVRIYSSDGAGSPMPSSGSLTRSDGTGSRGPPEPELLTPGSAIGRYRTLECVGIGGMGVVYSAYDPQLDRRVALKLLLGGGENQDHQRARLLREAQSMAKLSHPNVITVHDVGVWHGQVFVAMEFVEGGTLKSWMREERRSWPEVRSVMLAAGRGLVAAHEAGLVHRDFKPDNVLIGRDGRVRVTDFGLARWEDGAGSTGQKQSSAREDPTSSPWDEDSRLSAEVSLTRTGALVGTPAYMAPELFRHRVADAASDQYAFCVALYEALCGARPYRGETLAELATNVVSGEPITFPGSVALPRHVRGALLRGLARKRRDRFASMRALLAALERRVFRRWRSVVAFGALCAGGAGAWASTREGPASATCANAGSPIDVVWGAQRREAIARAFARSELRLAEQAAEVLFASVDAYALRWRAAAEATCEASRAGGRETFTALSERCLARGRVALDVALESLEDIDYADVARASGLVDSIAEDCGDEEALLSDAPPPVPAEIREDVERIRLGLAKVGGLQAAGEYEAGVELARLLDDAAEATDHDPLRADTKLGLGTLLDLAGEYEEAAEALEAAELLATSSRFHRRAAEALVHATYVHGVMLQRFELGRRLARRAEAVGDAAGMEAPFRGALRLNQASVEYSAGNYAQAERFASEALELHDRAAHPLRWADAAYNLATIRITLDRNEDAIETLQAYIDTYEEQFGRTHPEVAVGYHTLSVALRAGGQSARGERALRDSLAILEQTVGRTHPQYANPLSDLSILEAEAGNYVDAISMAREAMALRNAHGAEPLLAAKNRLDVARWLARSGKLDDAEVELEEAEGAARAAVGDEHPALAQYDQVRATLAAERGERSAAQRAMGRAEERLEAALGPDSEDLWDHRVLQARLLARLNATDEAIGVLRVLSTSTSSTRTPLQRAEVRFELARMLASRTPGSVEARTIAQQALRTFEDAGNEASASEAAQWLTRYE